MISAFTDQLHGFVNNVAGALSGAHVKGNDNAMTKVEKAQGKAPKYEQDLRKVMEDKSIDCVTIATPNHWHSLAAIWALQSGKHVYVEKPVSHNVSEGRRVVEAARKYGKICQAGTQSRSNPGMQEAIAYVRSGKIGEVKKDRTLYRIGQTRIHLDRVTGLGDFLELEVVLRPDQQESEGKKIADDLLSTFNIDKRDLIAEAYIDLLAARS